MRVRRMLQRGCLALAFLSLPSAAWALGTTPPPTTQTLTRAAPPPVKPIYATQSVDRPPSAPIVVHHEPAGKVVAISDLHGHYRGTVEYLSRLGLVAGNPRSPSKLTWRGGNTTLVIAGDILNKGGGSVELIDMIRALQTDAKAKGGAVIFTLGNHEAQFLAEPNFDRHWRDGTNAKGHIGTSYEMNQQGIDPEAVAAGTDPEGRGAWLRSQPMLAIVGDTAFVHAAHTLGKTPEEVESFVRLALKRGGYAHPAVQGRRRSLLGIFKVIVPAKEHEKNVEALGVKRIVGGHYHHAHANPTNVVQTNDGSLFLIDTGYGDDEGTQHALVIERDGSTYQLNEQGHKLNVPHWDGVKTVPQTP